MSAIISSISNYLYSYILIVLLVVGGLFFTFRSRFVQFRLFGEQFRVVMEKKEGKTGVSSFQALMVSTASRVGTGNIVGVATAICVGGFGSVFWMWVIALIGCASAFVESTLAQIYKKRGKDGSYGGPAYYIETALKCRPLAIVFSILLILTYGVGFNMLASYNLQSTFSVYSFYDAAWTPWVVGGVVALLVAVCLFGGGKRIVKVTGVLVPVMGVIYVLVALVVVLCNVTSLPAVVGRVFSEAFDFSAIFGGLSGSCLMYGIKRGLFSNEAGIGSAPNAAASAEVSHPVKQGLVQMFSVFLDTIVICSATAFLCMTSGVDASLYTDGGPYVQAALKNVLGTVGPIFITVAMFLFAFTTLLGNLYYVEKCIFHLLKREAGRSLQAVVHVVSVLLIFVGAGLSASLLWDLADVLMGGMALINIPVIAILGKYAYRALTDYVRKRKNGEPMSFTAKDIGITEELDYWH